MSPSKIGSNIKFAYDQYLVACNANGKNPVAPTETAKATITRLLRILIPTNTWLHVKIDDFGIEAQITKSMEHPPYALTIRTDYKENIVSAWYFSDETHEHGDYISSRDHASDNILMDIVEFCIVALRQYRFNFSASRKNKPTGED
jgi:hypothetical protein